jgi:hypothetical protein
MPTGWAGGKGARKNFSTTRSGAGPLGRAGRSPKRRDAARMERRLAFGSVVAVYWTMIGGSSAAMPPSTPLSVVEVSSPAVCVPEKSMVMLSDEVDPVAPPVS